MVGKIPISLGVNIDHVATLRNARCGSHPDPVKAALLAAEAGADGITAHLREDRRHITDSDIARLMQESALPLNLEMAATAEMLDIARKTRPHAVCLVPEKRQEVTTEGGLDVIGQEDHLKGYIEKLKDAGIRVSLFIDPLPPQLEASARAGADVVELHTGKYCSLEHGSAAWEKELALLATAAESAASLGLDCHAGHGLAYDNVREVAAITAIAELNIGHFLIGESVFHGLKESVARMKKIMLEVR